MATRVLGLGIAALVLGAGALPAWLAPTSAPRAPAADVAPPAAVVDVAAAVAAPVAAPPSAEVVAAAAPRVGTMRFPDGSTRPALNGVTHALEIPWPTGRPWSPVVETLTHGGTEWCKHADGSFSTTIVRVEEVSGQELQIPLCCTPRPGPVSTLLRQ